MPDAVVPVAVPAFQRREIELAFYADRARRDSLGAADRARLAALHLDRARETGNFKDVEQAERWARESLALREAHNSGTFALLASILMAQHRFPEALRAAQRTDALEPGVIGYRAKRHTGVIDVERRAGYEITEFWEPIQARRDQSLVLDPDEFHHLVSESPTTEQAIDQTAHVRAAENAAARQVGEVVVNA